MVRLPGLEPGQDFSSWLLRPRCLPKFHHNRAGGPGGTRTHKIYVSETYAYSNSATDPLVPKKGFEPPRSCEQQVLSLPCLPFHHSGAAKPLVLGFHILSLVKRNQSILTPTNSLEPTFGAERRDHMVGGFLASGQDANDLRSADLPRAAFFEGQDYSSFLLRQCPHLNPPFRDNSTNSITWCRTRDSNSH
jgi:hypothetical protein